MRRAILLLFLLAACERTNLNDNLAKTPRLDVRQFFNGDLDAWGLVQDDTGGEVSRFTMTLHGEWQGDRGTLHERFTFDDGRTSERTWQLTVDDARHFHGTTTDVVGTMTGEMSGNIAHMDFVQTLPRNGGTIDMTMDDTHHLIDERHIIDRIIMRKLGVRTGSVTVFFEKR